MNLRMKRFVVAALILLLVIPQHAALAWSEGGHHVIAALAFKQLTPAEQTELIRIAKTHPRYADDFKIPAELTDPADQNLWLIGRCGYWPDIARKSGEYNRPNWHYELAVTMSVGDTAGLELPTTDPILPADATLESRDLHITQAIELSKKVLGDKAARDADRAIALCWMAHLVADAHQPCHAGSLYAPGIFPTGDRGANSIETKQRGNMHALWDGLLGPRWTRTATNRRVGEILVDTELQKLGRAAVGSAEGMKTETWLSESRDFANSHVYSPQILEAITVAIRTDAKELPKVDLPEEYLKEAGGVAQQRAVEAAYRLGAMWRVCLH